MNRADQIPDEVVEAARYAFHNATGPTVADDWRASIAAALNAWPGVATGAPWIIGVKNVPSIILPLPQEVSDE